MSFRYDNTISAPCANESKAILFIKTLDLPNNVMAKSIEKYNMLCAMPIISKCRPGATIVKQGRQERRIFVAVFVAYNECEVPADPFYVAGLCEIGHDRIDEAFNENAIDIHVQPLQMTKFYLQRLNVMSQKYNIEVHLNIEACISDIQMIHDMCIQTRLGRDTLYNNPAKAIAIGLVYYQLHLHDHTELFEKYLPEAWFLSLACIHSYYDTITRAYNTLEDPKYNITFWFN
jgi:hypothetical protein